MRVGIKTIKKNAFLYDIYTVAKMALTPVKRVPVDSYVRHVLYVN